MIFVNEFLRFSKLYNALCSTQTYIFIDFVIINGYLRDIYKYNEITIFLFWTHNFITN